MKATHIGTIVKGQDGAIFGDFLFRLSAKGLCTVYRLSEISEQSVPAAQFTLDKTDKIVPHSNCVVFGTARYDERDEFPLLYSNVYNNYAKHENRLEGTTCVYRLQRVGESFSTELVQVITIGFTQDTLWRSETVADIRPYGNFLIDRDSGLFYGFTMRDKDHKTRYFAFRLPDVSRGEPDEELGVRRVVLGKEDVLRRFDCDYHRFIQGACCHNGIVYSVEGFTANEENPPAIRLIDLAKGQQLQVHYFSDHGMTIEPELIDFSDEVCYYADNKGNLYTLTF